MARGIPRNAEWGIGVAFIVAMVVALVLAIQAFEGPTSVILLVLGGVFLLVGLFFLTTKEPEAADAPPNGPTATHGSAAPPTFTPQGPATGKAPSFTPAAAKTRQIVVCPSCSMKVAASFVRCPHCGNAL
jgi:predicted membrane channel-forming protein YqfA (hemolysin III family)